MIIDKHLGILIEQYLRSEVTFGFEFEAAYRSPKVPVISLKPFFGAVIGYSNKDRVEREKANDDFTETLVNKFLKSFYKDFDLGIIKPGDFDYSTKGRLSYDQSIHPDAYTDIAFEFSTKKMQVIPANITQMVNFLDTMLKNGCYTNKTCSFHIHISFPNATDQDYWWLLLNLVTNENAFKLVKGISKDLDLSKVMDMYGKVGKYDNLDWARSNFLFGIHRNLRYYAKTKDEKYLEQMKEVITTEKENIIRLHPSGTFEWRGPRDFLDSEELDKIKAFSKELITYVDWVRSAQYSKKITIDGKEVLKDDIIPKIDKYINIENKPIAYAKRKKSMARDLRWKKDNVQI